MRTGLVALGRGVTTEQPFLRLVPTRTEVGMLRLPRVLVITLKRAGQRIWVVLSTLRPVLPAKGVLTHSWWVKAGRGVGAAVGTGVGRGVGVGVGLGVGATTGGGGLLLGGGLFLGVGVVAKAVAQDQQVRTRAAMAVLVLL